MASEKFQALRKEFSKGRVLLPGDEGYDASLERWSLTCVKPAAAVAQPGTAEEVGAVIKFATANGIAFNVKCGGHSTAQTSSAPSPEGMVLDLGLMRGVSVDPDAQTVSFQGGCLWKDVDDALWPHGLATVGGTVSHTGVGGLILHGGFGVLTGLHGLTIDILQSCQVVLADGSIVTASATENSDLFWALRGAGSSFGVVTEFTSKVFPQGDIWGGMMVFPADNLPTIVDFINHWGETNDGNTVFVAGFTHAPLMPGQDPNSPRPPVLFMQLAHVGANALEDGPKYFEPLLKLQTFVQKVGKLPYPLINKLGDEGFAAGKRYLFGGSNFTIPLSLSTAEAIRDQFMAFVDSHPETKGSICMLECIPNQKSRSVAPDATAFNSRGNYYNVAAGWTWENESFDQQVRDFNRQLQKDIRRLGYDDEALKDGVGQYINYASTDAMTAETAFGSNADRLRALKKQYDPENVFDKLWKLVGKVDDQWVA
ncbi:Fc.00g016640.m01.CDS01 [Cosmosporella sp. VM-42]